LKDRISYSYLKLLGKPRTGVVQTLSELLAVHLGHHPHCFVEDHHCHGREWRLHGTLMGQRLASFDRSFFVREGKAVSLSFGGLLLFVE
jgi:hypothetical protein